MQLQHGKFSVAKGPRRQLQRVGYKRTVQKRFSYPWIVFRLESGRMRDLENSPSVKSGNPEF